MDCGSVLALFDPFHQHSSSSTPSTLSTANHIAIEQEMAHGTHMNMNDASDVLTTGPLNDRDAQNSKGQVHRTVAPDSQPSNSATTGLCFSTSKNSMTSRLPSKPFIVGSGVKSSGPIHPSTRPIGRATFSTSQHDRPGAPGIRSVSLPSQALETFRRSSPSSVDRVVYTTRAVSLPESSLFAARPIVGLPHVSKLPTVDETCPLIDLTSPFSKSHCAPTMSSPSGSVIIHSSFSTLSEGPSRSSSPDLTEEDSIIVGNPLIGRSNAFLGKSPASPFQTMHRELNQNVHAQKATLVNEKNAGRETVTNVEKFAPQPIPALHGPPSLPYARCPSGAEGIVISQPSSMSHMIWGLREHADTNMSPKTPKDFQNGVTPGFPPTNFSSADTPASTLVGTPSSAFGGTPAFRLHGQGRFAPSPHPGFNDMKSRQAPTNKHLPPKRVVDRISARSGPKTYFQSACKENIVLGSPLELGDAFVPTPGGYTEYHYVEESSERVENARWQEFIPPDIHTRTDPHAGAHSKESWGVRPRAVSASERAEHSLPQRPSKTPSLRPMNSLTNAPKRTANNQKTDENAEQPELKAPETSVASRIPSAHSQKAQENTLEQPSAPPISLPPIFAIRKAAHAIPTIAVAQRPKLRDLPGIAGLLTPAEQGYASLNELTDYGFDGIVAGHPSVGASVRPEVTTSQLLHLWAQKVLELAIATRINPVFLASQLGLPVAISSPCANASNAPMTPTPIFSSRLAPPATIPLYHPGINISDDSPKYNSDITSVTGSDLTTSTSYASQHSNTLQLNTMHNLGARNSSTPSSTSQGSSISAINNARDSAATKRLSSETGALSNPRSIPIARLLGRHTLGSVSEEPLANDFAATQPPPMAGVSVRRRADNGVTSGDHGATYGAISYAGKLKSKDIAATGLSVGARASLDAKKKRLETHDNPSRSSAAFEDKMGESQGGRAHPRRPLSSFLNHGGGGPKSARPKRRLRAPVSHTS